MRLLARARAGENGAYWSHSVRMFSVGGGAGGVGGCGGTSDGSGGSSAGVTGAIAETEHHHSALSSSAKDERGEQDRARERERQQERDMAGVSDMFSTPTGHGSSGMTAADRIRMMLDRQGGSGMSPMSSISTIATGSGGGGGGGSGTTGGARSPRYMAATSSIGGKYGAGLSRSASAASFTLSSPLPSPSPIRKSKSQGKLQLGQGHALSPHVA